MPRFMIQLKGSVILSITQKHMGRSRLLKKHLESFWTAILVEVSQCWDNHP
jgi:predicted RNA-binding protein YlxR (DUF448 family)